MIVFINTCNLILEKLGIENVCLHSQLSQQTRIKNLRKFKNQKINVLLATDVASRGLDIPSVDVVINLSLPRNYIDYIHRAGRAARENKIGLCVSLVNQFDIELLLNIENETKQKMEEWKIKENDVLDKMNVVIKAMKEVEIFMSEKEISQKFDEYKERKLKQSAIMSKNLKKLKKLKKKQEKK